MKNLRLKNLLPDGYPRYVRVYDNGGATVDRYTVVFTGRYGNGVPSAQRMKYSLGLSENPTAPNGFCQTFESRLAADLDEQNPRWPAEYGKSNHLGKRIYWHELPEACRQVALKFYKELWRLQPDEARENQQRQRARKQQDGIRLITRATKHETSKSHRHEV